MFQYGIEHEVAFLKRNGDFADMTTMTANDLQVIIEGLPRYPSDYPALRIHEPSLEKRWYVEGYERFNEDGVIKEIIPKGIEIRTTPSESIMGAVDELTESFRALATASMSYGFSPAWISHNPFRDISGFHPSLNDFEMRRIAHDRDAATESIALFTFGPDMNISETSLTDGDLIDIGRKLTFYSPFIVPFSFSSPFYHGDLWDGYSVRTFLRTGDRHAVCVFVEDAALVRDGNPLIKEARSVGEHNRIEFKAFDAHFNFRVYASLLALLKGIVLDKTLPGRADIPSKPHHQDAARFAFKSKAIADGAAQVLSAARKALEGDDDISHLSLLDDMLQRKYVPSELLIHEYRRTGSIELTLRGSYEKFRQG